MYQIVPLAPSIVVISNTDMMDMIYRNFISEIIFLLLIYALICVAVKFNASEDSVILIYSIEVYRVAASFSEFTAR